MEQRTLLGLEPAADRSSVELTRPDLSPVTDLSLERLEYAGRPLSVVVRGGRGEIRQSPTAGPA